MSVILIKSVTHKTVKLLKKMEYLGVILDINLRYLYINSLLGKLGFIIHKFV